MQKETIYDVIEDRKMEQKIKEAKIKSVEEFDSYAFLAKMRQEKEPPVNNEAMFRICTACIFALGALLTFLSLIINNFDPNTAKIISYISFAMLGLAGIGIVCNALMDELQFPTNF